MSNPIMSNETYKMYAERIAKRDRQLNDLVLLATALEQLTNEPQSAEVNYRRTSGRTRRLETAKRHDGATEAAAQTRPALDSSRRERLSSDSSEVNLYREESTIWEETTGELGEPPAFDEDRSDRSNEGSVKPIEPTQEIENPEAFTVSTFVDVVDGNSYVSIEYCNSCNSYGQVQHCCAVCNLNLCLDCMKIEGHMHATITLEKLEIAPSPVDAGRAYFSNFWKSTAKVCLKSLVHASGCAKNHCQLLGCLIMKAVVSHMRTCAPVPSRHCRTCERVVRLICEHSMSCNKFDNCPVPSCKLVRDNISNKLSHQRTTNDVTADQMEFGVAALQEFNLNKLLREEFIESLSVQCIEVADLMMHNEQQSDVKRSELKICSIQ